MSYNITTWKTKKLENFIIPFKSLYISERTDWHPKQPKIINMETNEVSISCGCGQKIKGILKDGNLHIKKIKMSGEGSGYFMDLIFEPSLKQSKGILEATLIWENGDSITSLSVIDGVLKEEDLDI